MTKASIRAMLVCTTSMFLCAFSLIGALLVAVTLASCGGSDVASNSGSWTICLYLCGSNLESRQGWGTKTLNEICSADLPANVNVVIQAGGAKKWHNDDVVSNGARFVVEKHELKKVGDADDASMGDASTLVSFLAFCEEEYPADHTAVILWDHGGGPLKGACYDETEHLDALTLSELDEAFAKGVQRRSGEPYDIVGFDACLMGSLEIAAVLADDALWLVGSEEIEAGAGWDYVALLDAIKEPQEASSVGAAVCDGYMQKCATRNKDAAATLSVVDLSKIDDVEEALDVALSELVDAKETEVQALRHLVFGTRYAESFGGTAKEEGKSNLVDLKGMAEGNADGSADGGAAWSALAQAVDEAVAYRVCGTTVTGANGLALWYPQSFKNSDLNNYVSTSPLTSYARTLQKLYAGQMGKLQFSDAGSVVDEDKLSVTVDPATSDEFFDVYVTNRAVDGSYQDTNVDITDDWENLTFSYRPTGAVAITLDGMVLDAEVVSYEHEYMVFSAPVTVDGDDTNLRIAWIWDDDDSAQDGHYELLGVWNGVDHVTGIADRSEDTLKPGSTVGARSLYTDEVREEVVVGDTYELAETALPPGRYECCFVALDLRGNEYPSDVCVYEVDDKGNTQIISVGR